MTAETALYQKTDKELKTTKNQLATTTAKLNDTQSQLEAANTKNTELEKQNTDLTDKLTKMTARADTAEQTLEKWRQLPPPEQIKSIISDLAKTKKERDALSPKTSYSLADRKDLQTQVGNLVGTDAPWCCPPDSRAGSWRWIRNTILSCSILAMTRGSRNAAK